MAGSPAGLAAGSLLLFSRSVVSSSLQSHGLQHARLPCPSLSPAVCPNSCSLSRWCHPTISSSVTPSPPALNLSQHQSLFQWVSSSHGVAKVWSPGSEWLKNRAADQKTHTWFLRAAGLPHSMAASGCWEFLCSSSGPQTEVLQSCFVFINVKDFKSMRHLPTKVWLWNCTRYLYSRSLIFSLDLLYLLILNDIGIYFYIVSFIYKEIIPF